MLSHDEQNIEHIVQAVTNTPGYPLGNTDGQTADAKQMTDKELLNIIGNKMTNSHQWYGSGASATIRIKADQYYRGEPRGDEIDGRSQVVSRDVAEAVDGAMPSMMRVFASGDQVVVMEPTRQDAEDDAAQATDYLNHVFLQDNDGFQVLYTWFKDAFLKRNGIVKSWYETRISRQKESYTGLTQDQYQTFKVDPTVSIVEENHYPDPAYIPQPAINPQTGQPLVDPQTGQVHFNPAPILCDVTVISSQPTKKLVVENVPPDEFVIERHASSLYTANFMAQRRKTTVSDLIERGFDQNLVDTIADVDEGEYTQERIERFAPEDNNSTSPGGETLDKSMRRVWETEAYLRVDYDGDGIAEWRKVTIGGDVEGGGSIIIGNEEIDDRPFDSLTPKPDPHRFFGFGLADDTFDIQDIKTALLRGSLDSIYLANSPRQWALEGQVNLDDLLDSRVGGIVRVKQREAVGEMPTINAAPQAAEMIQYMDQVREKRTGVMTASAGLDPNIINSSATGANILDNNNQQRLELIARIFAETGVKSLFRRIFKLMCQHEDQAKVVKLRGKWVNVNPRDWKDRMDVTVSVGVGLNDKSKQLQQIMTAMNVDKEIITLQKGLDGPLLTAKNVYAKLEKMGDALGWKSIAPYYTDPDNAPPPQPPQPSPEQLHEVAMAQAQIAIENAKAQTAMKRLEMQAAVDTNQSNLDAQLAREKAINDSVIKKYEIDKDNETKIIVAQIGAQGDVQASAVGKNDAPVSVDESGKLIKQPNTGDLIKVITTELQKSFSGVQEGLAAVQEGHKALAAALTKPKKIITHNGRPDGDPIGIE